MPGSKKTTHISDAETRFLIRQIASVLAALDHKQGSIIFPEDTLEIAMMKADALQRAHPRMPECMQEN